MSRNKFGTLIIRSDPSGAIVTIGDTNKLTPALFDLRGRTSPYDIIIEKIGYDDYINKVIVQSGAKIEMNITLCTTEMKSKA